ncbi:hypothetical protein ACFPM0_03170 [Pseudonocardia sulfidoxydans]|uniref:hypothetical protein n=1 Tax=Pseudonocardia sulfidoxydans TaxID=54011 RepID=UPI00361EDEC9
MAAPVAIEVAAHLTPVDRAVHGTRSSGLPTVHRHSDLVSLPYVARPRSVTCARFAGARAPRRAPAAALPARTPSDVAGLRTAGLRTVGLRTVGLRTVGLRSCRRSR